MLEEVTENGVFVFKDEELIAKTAHIDQRIILCGHSHVNRTIWLSYGKIILNPGSVGLPAYFGNAKFRFSMESMTPHAKYALIYADKNSINIEQINCTYDWNAASAIAIKKLKKRLGTGFIVRPYAQIFKKLKLKRTFKVGKSW